MSSNQTAGQRFRLAVEEEKPLQVMGTCTAYTALLATRSGFRAIYLSGAGVANSSFGLPDLGMTGLNDVAEDARRITSVTDVPLLVDADTGWGGAFNIARTVKELVRSGVAACHIEDQVAQKRCGHRPNKALVDSTEMCDRIKAAVDGRDDESFVIMARTDAKESEGLESAIERSLAYVDAGADMIFAEALHTLEDYTAFTEQVSVPVLANITEFGQTPLFSVEELREVGVRLVLYPLSPFRAMSKAAEKVLASIRQNGHQRDVIDLMQSRKELYEVLDYHAYEDKLDKLFNQ